MSETSASSHTFHPTQSTPRLLVSVRDLEEARIAQSAKADLIDLKEPRNGSLGMVAPSIADSIASQLPSSTLSLALGELSEWGKASVIPKVSASFRYVKIGLSNQAANSNWQTDWLRLRDQVEKTAQHSFEWIAVIYADHEDAKSPPPNKIIEMAIETGCAGVLFDTWSKTSGSLLDHLSLLELEQYLVTIHRAGLISALAGSLRAKHFSMLQPLRPSVIAVRGAACENSDRVAKLSKTQICDLRDTLGVPTGKVD